MNDSHSAPGPFYDPGESSQHVVTAERIVKLAGPLNQWRFVCSCGRRGEGWHNSPEKAIERGHDHVR